jgi:hypothetical protein
MLIPCRSPTATLPPSCHYPAVLRQCRTRAGRPHAVSGRPMLIQTYHTVPLPRPCREPAVALRGHFQNGISVAWQGNGMAGVWHGGRTAWYVWIRLNYVTAHSFLTSAQWEVVISTVCHFILLYPALVCTIQPAARVDTLWREQKPLSLPKFEPQ